MKILTEDKPKPVQLYPNRSMNHTSQFVEIIASITICSTIPQTIMHLILL